MSQRKRSFEEDAFKRKKLKYVKTNDYYVENTVFKVTGQQSCFEPSSKFLSVKTTLNSKFSYGEEVIKEVATSATMFSEEKKITKTALIKLFSSLSINDIWSAVFYKQETDQNWQEELVAKIQGMQKDDAVKYVKNESNTFGKIIRELKGQKISVTSDNNYYLVRDLYIYFDCLEESSSVLKAEEKSIRNLDVNTLQSLIFNDVKYILK